jgi:MFS family permease
MGRLATALGLPEMTGLYLCSVVALSLAALLLFTLLRPDPLKVAAALDAPDEPREIVPRVPLRVLLSPAAAITGLATMVVANFVMVAVMAMAPVHMDDQGHDLRFVGLVISLHITGMFAPAPVTGRLTDRLGALPVAAGGTALLIAAGLLTGTAGDHAFVFALGLTLLGVGWNAALVSGSALLASAVPVAQRPRAEGIGELGMGVTAASATAIAGPVVGLAGYATLAFVGAIAAAALGPVLLALARRGVPATAVPAPRMLSG